HVVHAEAALRRRVGLLQREACERAQAFQDLRPGGQLSIGHRVVRVAVVGELAAVPRAVARHLCPRVQAEADADELVDVPGLIDAEEGARLERRGVECLDRAGEGADHGVLDEAVHGTAAGAMVRAGPRVVVRDAGWPAEPAVRADCELAGHDRRTHTAVGAAQYSTSSTPMAPMRMATA